MAEHDGKVTFDLELDDSKIRGELSRALNQIKSQAAGSNSKIKVEADTSGAMSQLKTVQAAANDIPQNRTVTVSADTSAANTPLEKTRSAAEDIPQNRTVTVSADTSAADTPLEKTRGTANDIPENINIAVSADTAAADTPLETTRGIVESIPREVHIAVSADTSGADSVLGGLTESGGSGSSTGNTLGKVAGAAAVVKAAKDIFTAGVSYDEGMAKTATLFPASGDIKSFGQRLLGLSTETGADIGGLWESTYNALSASVPFGKNGDNLFDFLRTTTYLSRAGFANADDVTKMVASMGNAYLQQYSPSEIANIAIKSQNKGQLTVGEMVQSAPQFVGNASVSHVPLEESLSMLAAMTLGGIQPAQSSTAINALFRELNSPKTETFKTMQAAFGNDPKGKGKDLAGLMDAGFTMMDVISTMESYMKSEGIAPGAVLPGEALTAYNQLAGDKMRGFREAYQYISGDEDVLTQAYNIMAGTTRSKLSKAGAKIKARAVGIGDMFKPLVNHALDLFNDPLGTLRNVWKTGGWSLDTQAYQRITNPRQWLQEHGGGFIPKSEITGGGFGGGRSGGGGGGFIKSKGAGRNTASDAEQAAASMATAMETVSTNATSTAQAETAAAEAMSEAAESAAEVNTNANTLKGDMYGTGVAMRTSESHARRMASFAGTATNRLSSAASSLSSLGSAIASLITSANAAASKARAGASVSAPKATAYAVGLDYVPYDNYPALLHKGEMILTAAEASSYRNTSITTNNNGMSVDALRAAFAGLAFDIDGRRAGMLVERGVSTQQGVRLNRQSYRG